jgi:hypothetical protein
MTLELNLNAKTARTDRGISSLKRKQQKEYTMMKEKVNTTSQQQTNIFQKKQHARQASAMKSK